MFSLDILQLLFTDIPVPLATRIVCVIIKDDIYSKFNAINNLNSMFYIFIYYCIKNVKHSIGIKKRIHFIHHLFTPSTVK